MGATAAASQGGRFSRHIPAVSRFAVSQQLDQVKADQMLRDAVCLVFNASAYPGGALPWLRENRPDVMAVLDRLEQAVDEAYLAADAARFPEALERWQNRSLEAWEVFRQRPPVIEREP